jgi:RNA polymerase sigma-70 factor (ECF subfamily)
MDHSDRVWRERGLLDAVLAGDERAWRAWYDESFPGLYAYALWRCGGARHPADEVVQETWLAAVRRLRSFDPARGSFAGWLRAIAANVLRNHFRRESRRRAVAPAAARPEVQPAGAEEERRARAERVAGALAALPDRYEAALRAKYLEGQSVVAIAAATGDTPKAVESLLSRARQAFRDAFLERE